MAGELLRIISDLHFGDRATRVGQLAQLRPMLDGVSHLVLNGDTLDTRPGPSTAHANACRAEVMEFFPREVAQSTFLTGNHDPNFSPHHSLDLAGGEVFVVHGDIFFENLVPWSADAPVFERLIAAELRALPPERHHKLEHRLALIRRVAAAVPRRHGSGEGRLKFALHYLADTVWPPLRAFRILRAWHLAPRRAAELARRHRPAARFIVAGHTHRPGIWRMSPDLVVINTGSYCPPLGATAVDLEPERLVVQGIELRSGEFRLGAKLAEFPLADR